MQLGFVGKRLSVCGCVVWYRVGQVDVTERVLDSACLPDQFDRYVGRPRFFKLIRKSASFRDIILTLTAGARF